MAQPLCWVSSAGHRLNVAAIRVVCALTEVAPVQQIDALGLLCPLPILRFKKRIQGLPSGSRVEFLTDDPSGRRDMQALCELSGHRILSLSEEAGGVLRYQISIA